MKYIEIIKSTEYFGKCVLELVEEPYRSAEYWRVKYIYKNEERRQNFNHRISAINRIDFINSKLK